MTKIEEQAERSQNSQAEKAVENIEEQVPENNDEQVEIPLREIPLSALQEKSLLILYRLNLEMILMSDDGQFRDWRGVRSYAPVLQEFKDLLKDDNESTNYMRSLIYQWIEEKGNNIENLQQILIKIDRIDIYEDTYECFQQDAKDYLLKRNKVKLDRTTDGEYIITTLDRSRAAKKQKLIIYDAFLMYSEADSDLAEAVKTTMEENFKMTVCVKDDFLGGIAFEHDASMTLIANRCRRVIIIISKNFVNCPADVFITKYAQHIGIEQSSRKIIPCLREECEVPSNLKILFHLKYYKHGKLFNFWEKLYEAVAYCPGDSKELDLEKFDMLNHGEYKTVDLPTILPKRQMPLMQYQSEMVSSGYQSSKDAENDSKEKSNEDINLRYLRAAPMPPTHSPNNTGEVRIKKKRKLKLKSFTKYFKSKKSVKV